MSDDGLSTDEKVNLLFKNFMNFTSTLDDKAFYDETALANNTNIFSDSILTTLPSTSPSYDISISDVTVISSLLETGISDISINSTWYNDKIKDSAGNIVGSFQKDASNINLRLERIKLDYVNNGGAAFVCYDNNGTNILQNIIPSNYAPSGYSISLEYEKTDGVLKPIAWLETRAKLAGNAFVGSSVNFGGALFDAKNGIITFYDVNGSPPNVFSNAKFYFTATKYIGPKGAAASGGGGNVNLDASTGIIIDNNEISIDTDLQLFTDIDTSVNALESTTATHTSNISVLDTSVNALESTTATHTTEIGVLDSSVNALESTTATHTTEIGMLDVSVNDLETTISDISSNFISRARDAISAGTGVGISDGDISIGQSVGTTNDVTFNNLNLSGTLDVDDVVSVNPRLIIDSSSISDDDIDIGSLILKNTYVDSNIVYRPDPSSSVYTHFDKSIALTRPSDYRNYYIGMVGNNSTTSNRFAIAGNGSGVPDPDIGFVMDPGGNVAIGSSLAINRDIVNNSNNRYELDVSGDTRLKGSLNLGSTANEFTVDAAGNTEIAGTLDVTGNLTLSGNLTVNGTTTTLDTQNLDVSDSLIGLSHGLTGTPVNDAGILINRGDSSNVFIGWDESEDKFTMGTTLATSSSTGNLTITPGTLVADLSGNAETVTDGVYTTGTQDITGIKTFSNLVIEEGKVIRLYGEDNDYSIGMKDTSGTNSVKGKGFNGWATIFKMQTNSNQGFLFTNVGKVCLLSIRASDGLTYINGNTGIGFDPSLSPYTNYKLSVDGTAYATDISAEDSIKVGNTTITDDISSNSLAIGSGYNEFTVDATGNTEIAGTLQVHSNSFEIGGGFNGSLADSSINFPRGSIGFSASGDDHVFLKTSKELQFFTNNDSSPAMKIDTSKNVLIYGRLESEVKNTYYTDTSGLEFAAAFYNDVNIGNYGISFEDPLFYEKVPILLLQNHRGAGSGKSYDVGRGVFLQLGHGIITDGTPNTHHQGVRIESISQKSGSGRIGMEFRTFDGGMNSVPAMRINYNNRVGIGTTSPGYTLDVSGTCNVSGTSTVTYDNSGDFNWIQTIESPISLANIGTTYSSDYNDKVPVLSIKADRGGGGATDDVGKGVILQLAHDTRGVRLETCSKSDSSTKVNLEIRTVNEDDSYSTVAMVVSHDDRVGIGIRDPVSTLDVSGDTRLKGSLGLGSNANEFTVDATGNTEIAGTLDVTGIATAPTASSGTNTNQIATTAFVDNAVSNIQLSTISAGTNGDEFTVASTGNTYIGGTLDVTGNVSFGSTVTVTGTTVVSDISATSSIKVGNTTITDDISSNSLAIGNGYTEFTVDAAGNTEIAGTLDVTGNLTLSGNLTVNGTTTTLDTQNLDVSDSLIGLSHGLTGTPVNDAGILINRGNSSNVFMGWDESAKKFTMGTTTATSSSTGNLTISTLGTLVANLSGNADTVTNGVYTTGTQTIGGSKTFSGNTIFNNLIIKGGNYIRLHSSYSGDTYSIGMRDLNNNSNVEAKGFNGWATRFSMNDNANQGFLFTNVNKDCLLSIRASDGLTYINGNTGIGFDPTESLYTNYKLSVDGTAYATDISAEDSIKVGSTTITDDISSNSLAIGNGYTEFTVDAMGNTEIAGTLDVTGDTRLVGSLGVGANATEFTVDAAGNTDIAGTLNVSNVAIFDSNVSIGKTTDSNYNLDVSGTFRVKCDDVNMIKVTRNDPSNNPYVFIGRQPSDMLETGSYYDFGYQVDSTDDNKAILNYEYGKIPLHVGSGFYDSSANYRKVGGVTNSGGSSTTGNREQPLSIVTKHSILVGGEGVFIYSDKRIKNNIQTIDDNQALLDFRKLNPCTYSYVDQIKRGNSTVYGFIAQEVEEVLPYACDTQVETVPNIYGIADVSGEYLILQDNATFNDLDTDLKDSSGNNYITTLQVYNDNNNFDVYVDNIINETTLTLKVPLRTEDCMYDSSSNKYQIFIYGQKVNNFKALDKNAIWTVAAAATQEIDRQQQADKVRIAELETKVETLENQLVSVLQRLTTLENA